MEATGERWFADETSFLDDLPEWWGDWGVASEITALRDVLVRRPGPEIEGVDPAVARFRDRIDPELARAQHDNLCNLYRTHGVTVHYVEQMAPDKPNAMFMRDIVAGVPEGVILARPAMRVRRGEERYAARTLASLGVPIIRTVNGRGTFECADLMWVDEHTAIIGLGNRTNREGAAQVAGELQRMGVTEIVFVGHCDGGVHLDGCFNIASHDVAAVFPWQTPFEVTQLFRRRGMRIVELTDIEEVKGKSAVNFVALSPGRIVIAHDTPRTADALLGAGVEVIPVDVSELRKGWGSLHCMTAFLKRDRI